MDMVRRWQERDEAFRRVRLRQLAARDAFRPLDHVVNDPHCRCHRL